MLISLSPDLNNTDQCEETAALIDLVESGTNLLRTVDFLLLDVQRVSEISDSRKCPLPGILIICVSVVTS